MFFANARRCVMRIGNGKEDLCQVCDEPFADEYEKTPVGDRDSFNPLFVHDGACYRTWITNCKENSIDLRKLRQSGL